MTKWPLAAASVGIVLFASIGFARGDERTSLYIVVTLLMGALVTITDRRVGFSRGVVVGIVAWTWAHMAAGLVPVGDSVLYNAWLLAPVLKVDQAVHFLAYALVTAMCWQATGRRSSLVAVLCSAGLGSINEVVEFVSTAAFEQNEVGGFANMGWDLVFNLTGATAVGLWLKLSDVWESGPADAVDDEVRAGRSELPELLVADR